MKRALAAALCAGALMSAAPAFAWLDLQGSVLQGKDGYNERALNAVLTVTPKFEWDDPDIPMPFSAFTFGLGRVGRERDAVDGATYRTEGSLGARIFSRSAIDFSYAVTPNLSESTGAYRAREWRFTVAAGWEGLLPRIDQENPPLLPELETRVTLSYGNVTHEQRVQTSTDPAHWTSVGGGFIAAGVAETYRRGTTARFRYESNAYDEDLAGLAAKGEFSALARMETTASPELSFGFPSGAWEAGIDQLAGEYLKLTGEWRSVKYEAGGLIAAADTLRLKATVFLGLYFTLHGTYESFRPDGFDKSTFTGGGLGFHF